MYLMFFSLQNPSWGQRNADGTQVPYPLITSGVQLCSCSAKATRLFQSVSACTDGTSLGSVYMRDAAEASYDHAYTGTLRTEYTALLLDTLVVANKLPGVLQRGFYSSSYTFYDRSEAAPDAYQAYLGWQLWRQWSQVPDLVRTLLTACNDTTRAQQLLNVLRFLWMRAQQSEAAYYAHCADVVRTMTQAPKKYGRSIIDPQTSHINARHCRDFIPGTTRSKARKEAQQAVSAWIGKTGYEYISAPKDVLAAAKLLLPAKRKEEW